MIDTDIDNFRFQTYDMYILELYDLCGMKRSKFYYIIPETTHTAYHIKPHCYGYNCESVRYSMHYTYI